MNTEKTIKQFLSEIKAKKAFSFLEALFSSYEQSEVFFVGGIVRDTLLGQESKDYDIVIRNVAPDILESFLQKHGEVHLVGKKFGVFKFVPAKQNVTIDIALPRQDFSFGTGKYTDVSIKTDPVLEIQEDLSRRDFTINAMAIDVKNEILIDPFDGQTDLKEKKIQCVGKPQERFQEDYTRILRGIRFACQLDFEIENATWEAMKTYIPHINDEQENERLVPYESIAKELNKAFYLNPVLALDLLDTSDAIKELMPELLDMKGCVHPKNFHSEGDVWVHTRLALSMLQSDAFKQEFPKGYTALSVYGVLFHDCAKPMCLKTPEKDGTDRIRYDGHDREGAKLAKRIAQRLKLSSPEQYPVDAEDLAFLVKYHLFLLSGPMDKVRNTTLEKYFFNENKPGQALLQVIFCDAKATIPEGKEADMTLYHALKERLENLQEDVFAKNHLPKPILSGEEIMQTCQLEAGPIIGTIKEGLREKQLAKEITEKEEAIAFVKDYAKQL